MINILIFVLVNLMSANIFADEKKKTYDELKALFDQGTALNPEDLPASGIIKLEGVSRYLSNDSCCNGSVLREFGTKWQYAFTKDSSKQVVISIVSNAELSNEDAVRHLSSCSTYLIPNAVKDEKLNALVQWNTYSNVRKMHLYTGYSPMSVDHFRVVKNSEGKNRIVHRMDYSDSGFWTAWIRGYSFIPAWSYPGYAYNYLSEDVISVSQSSANPDCNKLISPYRYYSVTGN